MRPSNRQASPKDEVSKRGREYLQLIRYLRLFGLHYTRYLMADVDLGPGVAVRSGTDTDNGLLCW